MPPKRSKKALEQRRVDHTVSRQGKKSQNSSPRGTNLQMPSGMGVLPRLVVLPPELFDEIVAYFPTLPLDWYYDTSTGVPDNLYAERAETLRALSQTCKAMRIVTLPRLWARLDICFVPTRARGTWYKYVMQNLKRKADGLQTLDDTTLSYVRTVSFTITKFEVAELLPYVPKLLKLLVELRTIQVTLCRVPGEFKKAIGDSSLPSVRTLVLPTGANALVFAARNALHVRCAGGPGSALIAAMKGTKCERLDGMINWSTDPKLVGRLVKYAPFLLNLEIRHPVNRGLLQTTAPAGWAGMIPALSGLKNLRMLTLTFPHREEVSTDVPIISAAREVMRNSALKGEKTLIVRRVEAPYYRNDPPHEQDLQFSFVEEKFWA